MNPVTLYLVCDKSGSMAEAGKPFIVRTAVMTIAALVRLGYADVKTVLCGWSDAACEVCEWEVGDEYPISLLDCDGRSNVGALVEFFESRPEGRILILSDGFWTRKDQMTLSKWRETFSEGALRIVRVGADSNPRLKGAHVYLVEDLLAAVEDWLGGGRE